jgi:transposase
MNLTHPAKWFLRCGGTDAEGGGSDGVGGFAQAWREYPGAGADDGALADTVRRYLRGGERSERRKPTAKRAEKLDDFKDYIVDRMRAASPARIPAAVLFREIKERGYRGGETRVKQFVRTLLPEPVAEPIIRFETEPGQQMQADWATVGRGADRLSVFIATLGWSRVAYVEFCDDERVETLIRCHENAFVVFGGGKCCSTT